jgi:hypothetical protein
VVSHEEQDEDEREVWDIHLIAPVINRRRVHRKYAARHQIQLRPGCVRT